MDPTAQTATWDSEIINETVVTGDVGIRQPKQPQGLKNNQRATVTSDEWIRQPQQPRDSKIIKELLSRVTP
jgi:hypothetical protein